MSLFFFLRGVASCTCANVLFILVKRNQVFPVITGVELVQEVFFGWLLWLSSFIQDYFVKKYFI